MALLHVPLPPAQTGGGEDIIYIFFLIFPEHPEFWTPLQIPIGGPPLAAPLQFYCGTAACVTVIGVLLLGHFHCFSSTAKSKKMYEN